LKNKERVELTGRGHRRGPAGLEIHIEVLPAVPDNDGVHDGDQEIKTRSKA
jgi:hypothetical protein